MRSPLHVFPLLITSSLITVAVPLLPLPIAQQGIAQDASSEDRQADADNLLQQGIQQHQISQFREALQSWQQALEIYREIGDRAGEGTTLNNLGSAYADLGQGAAE
jgi:tetratricopeptide (TPR) repeat protein